MKLLQLTFQTILAPFVLLIHSFFELSYTISENYGTALILLSLFITAVTAPLYYFAEKWKNSEKKVQKRMYKDIQSINTYFEGQKRFYLTKTARKIYGYKWWYSFRTSLGLLIQIPFFFAAYEVLSHYTGYKGVSFLFVNDLAKPDALFAPLNILPFAMTAVNLAYAVYYTQSIKWNADKDLYILAAVFLVLLYNSPAALLIYWTMNNVFSFIKGVILRKAGLSEVPEILARDKHTKPFKQIIAENINIIYFFFFVLACSLQVYSFLQDSIQYKYIILQIFLFAGIITLIGVIKKRTRKIFFATCVLWICYLPILYLLLYTVRTNKFISDYNIKFLAGFYPTFVIYFVLKKWISPYKPEMSRSTPPLKHNIPVVFFTVFWLFFYLPILYWIHNPAIVTVPFHDYFLTLLTPACILLLFLAAIHYLLPKTLKTPYNIINIFMLLVCCLYSLVLKINVGELDFFTLKNFSTVSNMPLFYYVADALALSCALYCAKVLLKKKAQLIMNLSLLLPVLLSVSLFFTYKNSERTTHTVAATHTNDTVSIDIARNQYIFSKNKTNIVCVLVDMFNGNYLGRIVDNEPSYKQKLSGFIWYKDNLSVSTSTIRSLSGLLGGHTYVSTALNTKDYHDVNSKAITAFFDHIYNSGYDITIAPSGDYSGVDMSRYRCIDDTNFLPHWKQTHGYGHEKKSKANIAVLIMLSILQSAPYHLKYSIYDKEQWLFFHRSGKITALREETMDRLATLDVLPDISVVKETKKGQCMYIHSNLPHCPYAINKQGSIMNAEDFSDFSYTSFNNKELALCSAKRSLDSLTSWFAWMKKHEVYDNTVIYIFADHGNDFYDSDIPIAEQLTYSNVQSNLSPANALLLVKPAHTAGKLQIDSRCVSSADLRAMLTTDANLTVCNDSDPRTMREEQLQKRTRIFFAPDFYFLAKNTYYVTGSMFDPKSWSMKPPEGEK